VVMRLHTNTPDALKCVLSRGSTGERMFTTKDAQIPAQAAARRTSIQAHHEMLAGLIAAAGAALDSDRDVARAYIEKAAALLEKDDTQERWQDHARAARHQRGGLAPWQARRVKEYVANNLGGRIRTTDLADIAQLSASHFTRAFKETFGETPIGYVARQRMLYAQELMLNSAECLSQIALTCGHCDQSHFTRVFRRKVGMSPRAWRRQFAGGLPSRSAP
jgi:AraC family transcriptional regulator